MQLAYCILFVGRTTLGRPCGPYCSQPGRKPSMHALLSVYWASGAHQATRACRGSKGKGHVGSLAHTTLGRAPDQIIRPRLVAPGWQLDHADVTIGWLVARNRTGRMCHSASSIHTWTLHTFPTSRHGHRRYYLSVMGAGGGLSALNAGPERALPLGPRPCKRPGANGIGRARPTWPHPSSP